MSAPSSCPTDWPVSGVIGNSPPGPAPDDGSARGTATSAPILLYDGTCGVCGAAVRFVLQRDPDRRFRFAALDSPAGRALRAQAGVPDAVDTLIVIRDGRAAIRSTAVLWVCDGLGWPWRLALIGRVVPSSWRDALYDWVARHRQDWSRRRQLACMIPTPAQRQQFLTTWPTFSVPAEQSVVSRDGLPSPQGGDVP